MQSPRTKRLAKAKACVFCGSDVDDELQCGKLFSKDGVSVHYYCLLFSSGLGQHGESDSDGIVGFIVDDIKKEVKRGKRLKCSYCKKTGATIGCYKAACRRAFHLHCGQKANSLQQFFGNYPTYCSCHKPNQVIPESEFPKNEVICPICFNPVECRNTDSSLWAPCCKTGWFHRICIQKQALSSGYFFRCPLCNNTDEFQEEMLLYGIYIPQQDASWELEQNAYQDLLFRHSQCDAPCCICPKGRKCNKKYSLWHLVICQDCGSEGRHVGCEKMIGDDHVWKCNDCMKITSKLNKKTGCKSYSSSRKVKNSIKSSELLYDKSDISEANRGTNSSQKETTDFSGNRRNAPKPYVRMNIGTYNIKFRSETEQTVSKNIHVKPSLKKNAKSKHRKYKKNKNPSRLHKTEDTLDSGTAILEPHLQLNESQKQPAGSSNDSHCLSVSKNKKVCKVTCKDIKEGIYNSITLDDRIKSNPSILSLNIASKNSSAFIVKFFESSVPSDASEKVLDRSSRLNESINVLTMPSFSQQSTLESYRSKSNENFNKITLSEPKNNVQNMRKRPVSVLSQSYTFNNFDSGTYCITSDENFTKVSYSKTERDIHNIKKRKISLSGKKNLRDTSNGHSGLCIKALFGQPCNCCHRVKIISDKISNVSAAKKLNQHKKCTPFRCSCKKGIQVINSSDEINYCKTEEEDNSGICTTPEIIHVRKASSLPKHIKSEMKLKIEMKPTMLDLYLKKQHSLVISDTSSPATTENVRFSV